MAIQLERERSHASSPSHGVEADASILISAGGIVLDLGGKRILDDVSLFVRRGEIVTLIGPNGAGKSTLARVLLGLVPPTAGTLYRRAGLRFGYVPQRFRIDPIIPLSVRRFMSLNTAATKAQILDCLAETGAASLLNEQMAHLSGGEFQRVLLARSLAREPDLLVLDEPAQAVDFAGAARLYDLINEIRKKRGCGVLLISHDLHVVLGASDRVICLNRHIICEGVPGTVARHPEYVRLFGPEASKTLGFYFHDHSHNVEKPI